MKAEDGTGSRHPSWRCGNVTPPISFDIKKVDGFGHPLFDLKPIFCPLTLKSTLTLIPSQGLDLNHKKHASRVSHGYRGSRQGLVQARALARYPRKKKNP